MKARTILIALLAVTFALPEILFAQSAKLKSSKMTVTGSSTLHEWESVVEKLECKANYKVEQNILVELKDAFLKIPVTSIKSPKGKMMDNKTYEAFNYEKNPTILFTLTTAKINSATLSAELKGNLAMAGVTKPVEVQVNYKVQPNGDLVLTGSKKLKMSDFKMESPTAMMGTIKVGDEVTIKFELTLTNTNTIL
jgi:polyisoprenoid-binding protein YceI